MDNFNMLFRNKIKSKFSLQIAKKPANNKSKNTVKPSYISSLPLSILAKSLKEINKISKFFKKNPSSMLKKSYVQVSFNLNISSIARETLKIKEVFLSLQNKKIEQVQKIISRVSKPKPWINMTTKEHSQKQVIVSISINNTRKYIKDSSTYIININKALKGIKSNIIADFIQIDDKGIIISTNNIVSSLDL